MRAHVINSDRYIDPVDNTAYIDPAEIWERTTKAAARKATAPDVNYIAVDEKNGGFYIFQVSGYSIDRGLYCDLLDHEGRVIG